MGDAGERREVVVVGAGLAGLSCAFELAERGHDVLLLEAREVVGGRTSSWVEAGMPVESGLHRFLGHFTAVKDLMARSGIDVDEAITWEDEIEVRVPDGGPHGLFPLSARQPVRTAVGLLRNNDVLSPLDKASLVPFLAAGVVDYALRPGRLDRESVADRARRHGVRPRALQVLLVALTAGIFFLPPERFSAFHFFGLVSPGVPRAHRLRLGAFRGGMTEAMTGPIAAAIEAQGAEVRTGTAVDGLVRDGDRIVGVQTSAGPVQADDVILATSCAPAQQLVASQLGEHPWFLPFLQLPTTPSTTVQLDLDTPATEVDRATFAPGTAVTCFSEQSRTTFPQAAGRLSIILSPPEAFLHQDPDTVLQAAIDEARRVGIDLDGRVRDHRVVALPHDFSSLEPGHRAQRPTQDTPVEGLTLAGDYTRQRFVATMEGAVVSGRRAAQIVDRRRRG